MRRRNVAIYLLYLTALSMLAGRALGDQSNPNDLRVLRNPNADQHSVNKAIERAKKGSVGSRSIWLEVAADTRYPAWHRRVCLYQYFKLYAKDTTVRKLAADLRPTRLFRSKDIYCWTGVTALPTPFAHDNRIAGFEYYALFPRLPDKDRSAIVLKVRGAVEGRRPLDRPDDLPPDSPFLQAFFDGKEADKLHVVAAAIAESE
jgi:hypothetical protein